MSDVFHREREKLLAGIAEYFTGVIVCGDESVGSFHLQDADAEVIIGEPKSGLALQESLLGALPVGDVVDHSYGSDDPPRFVPYMFAFLMNDANFIGAVLHDSMVDFVGAAPIPERSRICVVDHIPVIGMYGVKKRAV